MYPDIVLRFHPIYQSRVWGGRTLESRFGRKLPDSKVPYGESWEISDRPEADSVVASEGAFHGHTLSQLWADRDVRNQIFGPTAPDVDRFPLLCKILDAQDKLSIQVHPPKPIADQLGGEPKTEVWYIADASPGAKMYVGLKKGVTEESFRKALRDGTVDDKVHSLFPKKGDFIFIESGRLHAIGEGLLIYEIQQNSDTTYRIFDWNRLGLDGKPRELHIEESLMCIDFSDVEPTLDKGDGKVLCQCEHFTLEQHRVSADQSVEDAVKARFAIITVVDGILKTENDVFKEGDFFMIPFGGSSSGKICAGTNGAKFLLTTW